MRTWLTRLLALALILLAGTAAVLAWLLRGSLPTLDGDITLPGLSSGVRIERDAQGTVTIDADSESDALRALGYVHAQERYFEMDLMRRIAAGELSALFGPKALDTDRHQRAHRMRARVEASLATVAGDKLPQLQAYAEGANAGLADLHVRPWTYLLLRQSPEPWHPADSALAGFAMYFDLQDPGNARELALWKLRPHLPPALFDLLRHSGSEWDAPLTGPAFGNAPLPSAAQVNLRTLPADDAAEEGPTPAAGLPRTAAALPGLVPPAGQFPGSNNFAVSGALTADGRAIVADDMHLGLRVPNIWFRARLRYPDPRAPGGRVDVQGFTLPGLPAVIVGSNGHVAWGFTNSYGDYLDWKIETPCAGTSAACAPLQSHVERIAVAGADPVALEVRETAWGPVLHDLPDGRLLTLRWTAHRPGAINFGLADFALAGDLDAALAIADRTAMPTQNLVIGDHHGRIAWRLLGPLPTRNPGCTAASSLPLDIPDASPDIQPAEATATGTRMPGAVASSTAETAEAASCMAWDIATDQSPMITDAARLWTANARVASGQALERIGDGGYALGARQRQIRDRLQAGDRFSEHDLLAIQLDDRALLMTRWQQLLRSLPTNAETPALRELAAAAADWSGHADIDSVAYRLVREWRSAVQARLLDGLTAPARAAMGHQFQMPAMPQLEGIAWPLVTQRPEHLLPRRFGSWDALFEDAAHEVVAADRPGSASPRTWGEFNTSRICHPLATALPEILKPHLCMPAQRLPGDSMMPRVQGPAFGASQRMVVSPGREADGIAHMPGGQSGHPLSPFWGAGHDDWASGRPSPFLPGPARHVLQLSPRRQP